MKIKEVTNYLDVVFRPELQEDYDNSGFLLGDPDWECTGALVSLDLTPAVLQEAMNTGASLIVTHHPFIFGGVKRITAATETGRMIMGLIDNNIAVYAAHTNLDSLAWGVSAVLAEKLGLEGCRILKPADGCDDGDTFGFGMVGELRVPVQAGSFLDSVKTVLQLPMIRYAGNLGREMKRVAVCGGAGAFLIEEAAKSGADIYMTADLKYHDFQRPTRGMVLCDIGHYESEQFAKEIILRTISEKFSNFACRISGMQHGIVSYI